ncbi:MAG: glycosyltransferase family 25 protein [Desulfovibrionales bacterium]|nr:glycosyltransferase family 25 protein [Desulfovibrionales bacterium]
MEKKVTLSPAEQMDIFIINLARSVERRKKISARLSAYNLSFSFFNAVEASDNFVEKKRYKPLLRLFLRKNPLSWSTIACFASHFRLWEKCVELNKPIFIMEDDAIPSQNFIEALELAGKNINKFECIRLYATGGGTLRTIKELRPPFTIQYSRKGTLGAVAYMISPEGAKKLISSASVWIDGPEIYMNNSYKHGVGCFILHPTSVAHDLGESTRTLLAKNSKNILLSLVKEIHCLYVKVRMFWFEKTKLPVILQESSGNEKISQY